MNVAIFSYFLILFLTVLECKDIYGHNCIKLHNVGTYSIGFTLGNSPIFAGVNQVTQGLRVMQSTYKDLELPSCRFIKNYTFDLEFAEYSLIEYQDTIKFSDELTTRINFYVMSAATLFSFNKIGIGLPHNFTNKELSLIHQLKNDNKIKKLSYTFYPHLKHEKAGYLYFGEVPDEVINSQKYRGDCDLIKNITLWSCYLSKVKFGESEFVNKWNMSFQSNERDIVIPYKFYNELKGKYLFEYFEKGSCREIYSVETYCYIFCSLKIFESLPPFEFFIGNSVIKIPLTKLISKLSDGYVLDLQIPVFSKDEWIFGTHFLDLFISTFDYENEKVFLYSNEIEIISLKYVTSRKSIFIFTLIMMITQTFILLYFSLKKDLIKGNS